MNKRRGRNCGHEITCKSDTHVSLTFRKWLLTIALLFAVTDLDGTLTRTNTLCIPFYCPEPFADSHKMLEGFDEILYLSCKPWLYAPAQQWWLDNYDFPEGDSKAIGPFPNGCVSYQEKCNVIKADGRAFTHGFSEDAESLAAYKCAGIPNIIKVIH